MNESNTVKIGDRFLSIKTPTLKVLNEFKSESGFDIATNPEAMNVALGDFKKIAKISAIICEDISDKLPPIKGEALSNYIYENATIQDFREIMSFFSEKLRESSTGTVRGNPSQKEIVEEILYENPN